MSKVVEYVGFFHVLKDQIKESWTQYWSSKPQQSPPPPQPSNGGENDNDDDDVDVGDGGESNFRMRVKERLERLKKQTIRRIDRSSSLDQDYSHLTRSKTRKELLQISAAVMGIEFSYAAETAFVSPLLLNLGLRHRHLTLMWLFSPLIGFFVTPLLGSLSDGCRSNLGRRRPFILLLSIGIILGLILVPNGKLLGRLLGDTYKEDQRSNLPPSNIGNQENQEISPIGLNFLLNSSHLLSQKHNPTDGETFRKKKTSAYFSSKFGPSEDQSRARNDLMAQDESTALFLKALGSKNTKKFATLEDATPNYFGRYAILPDERESESQSAELTAKEIISGIKNQKKDNTAFLGNGENGEKGEKATTEKVVDKSRHEDENSVKNHPWSLIFTVLGTVLLDFNADACQSPARAYMLDVTIPDDHARGLSTFTVMAGLGGSLGYFLGALNWENTYLGDLFGGGFSGQVRAVFTLVLFIFIGCVLLTLQSFREIPLERLWATQTQSSSGGIGIGIGPRIAVDNSKKDNHHSPYSRFHEDVDVEDPEIANNAKKEYGATSAEIRETSFSALTNGESNIHQLPIIPSTSSASEQMPTFREYLKTIILLPKSLQWLCLTNFFCWMSLVCYSLYFTDFVGEAVFLGDPTAPFGSTLRQNYDAGIRFGCWGMSLYSLSCSMYSLCIESFVSRFGAKRVYITGQLVYSCGMVLMAIFRNQIGVIVFSWTAGIMYATLFTMPYLLVARYHAAETFDVDIDDLVSKPSQMRGLGTDVAIVSSMVFLAQMTQALTLGSVVAWVGSTTAIIWAAAVFAGCGALCATKVLYLDL